MKLLHTSDWHVGKTIRGHSRAPEHSAVLDEIGSLVGEHSVDLVIVAGDLFETASPSAEAESLVYRTLLRLLDTGAQVAVISGNHDNARRLRAVAPVFEALGRIHLVTEPTRLEDGGLISLSIPGGEEVRLAMLPFVSQRGVVRAKDLMEAAAYENTQAYAERMRLLIEALTAGFGTDTVNILAAHAFVYGGRLGGGERDAHFIDDYAISAQSFPVEAGYVALGHVHRAQKIPGAAPIHYCGSPLQLDFGEEDQVKQVNLVEIEPGIPPRVTPVILNAGRALRTLRGSMVELAAQLEDGTVDDDAWLRVLVDEPRRAGLADDVRELLGERVVDVRMDAPAPKRKTRGARRGRAPTELFAEFLAERNIEDPLVSAMFAELLDAQLESAQESAS
ncbi:MAG: exonuclease SbcCD subunit D [Acidimicrobiaceae bacterium]|nr:exonuclease SbcCD subunit D [Acidimicrobiaceae bacterium]